MDEPFTNEDRDLVVQYTVKMDYEQKCGGAYIKLLDREQFDQREFSKETPYLLMFGPDVCGGMDQLRLVLRKEGSIYYEWTKDVAVPIDTKHHVYTLIWRRDGLYEVRIDGKTVAGGSIQADFAIGAPREIPDEHAYKPRSWQDKPYEYDPEIERAIEETNIPKVLEVEDLDSEEVIGFGEHKRTKFVVNPTYLAFKEQ